MEVTANKKNNAGAAPAHDLVIVAAYRDLLARNALDSLDALFDEKLGEPLTKPGLESWRQRLRVRLDDKGTTRTFYLKRFTNPPARARREVKRAGCAANSVAGTEWNWMKLLAGAGISCALPVAFGEQLTNGREKRSAVLSAEVAGLSLETWAARRQTEDRQTARRLNHPLADLVAKLHRAGFVHRDLYLSHVFFDPGVAVEESLRLIDLQRVFRPAAMMQRWIVKDIASLNYSTPPHIASTADRVRWLRRYLGVRRLNDGARRMLYRVVGKTQQIAGHDAKRTARLNEK